MLYNGIFLLTSSCYEPGSPFWSPPPSQGSGWFSEMVSFLWFYLQTQNCHSKWGSCKNKRCKMRYQVNYAKLQEAHESQCSLTFCCCHRDMNFKSFWVLIMGDPHLGKTYYLTVCWHTVLTFCCYYDNSYKKS